MENQELKTLLERYIAQTASPEEVRQLLSYFELAENGATLKSLISLKMEEIGKLENTERLEDAPVFNRVEKALSSRIDEQQQVPVILSWRKRLIPLIAAAAAVLIIAGVYMLWNVQKTTQTISVYAAYGKHLEVHLPDSTKVWLNAGTTLQYPLKFADGQRSVTLTDGEAYFEVTHDKQHPFVVHANGALINVLGTSFEISSFKNEQLATITVRTGKVGVVPSTEKTVFLLPGERAAVNKGTHKTEVTKIDTADIAAWRSERIIFNNQPMAEVFHSLERKYNVHIEIRNTRLLKETITMRLNNQPLANVLAAISFSNHLTYSKINEQLIVVK